FKIIEDGLSLKGNPLKNFLKEKIFNGNPESLWTDNRSHAPVETGSKSCKSQPSGLSILYRAVS
ncbi:MAG: hypothetical protein AAF630_02340, partial [Cyanobacteria bacterium P01_C01_bin.38]